MSLGGIIAGAVGGLGVGAQQVGQNLNASAMQDQQFSNAAALDRLRSDLDLQKAEALEQFKNQTALDMGNQTRQAMVDRINAAKGGIINQALAAKYGQSDAAVADADAGNTDAPLTDDQKAAIAQAKGLDADRLANDPDVATKAAIATGDIDPAKAATLLNQKEITQLRQEGYMRSVEAKLEAAKDRSDVMLAIAQIRAESAGGDGKMPSDAKMIEYLVKNGMDKKTATDRVMGTGAGATKDPVAMATQLASSLINSNAVKVTKDDPPGTTQASKAMEIATGQIQAAEKRFGRGADTPVPTPVPAVPGAPRNDPLGLFKK
jgi:hypothetical protein